MSSRGTWEEGNARHLAASLAWLRLRLESAADERGATDGASIAHARDEVGICATAMEAPPALSLLAARFGLTRFESDLLLLCAGMELDTRVADLCARWHGDVLRPYPTFALALGLFEEPAWDALAPERPLRQWGLVQVQRLGQQPLATCPLRADERIVDFIKGLNRIDERFAPLLTALDAEDGDELPPSQQRMVDQVVAAWSAAGASARLPAILLLGTNPASKRGVAFHAGERIGCKVFVVAAGSLPTAPAELDVLARLWQRESALLPWALLFERAEGPEAATHDAALTRFVARSRGVFFIDTHDALAGGRHSFAAVDVAKPTASEQRAAWSAALGEGTDDTAAALSAQFDLEGPRIRRVAAAALEAAADREALHDTLWDACRAAARPRLDRSAQRIDVKTHWDDIVLPAEPLDQLHQLCAQVRCRACVYEDWGFAGKMNRGLGISALFEGASGVGKTMAAEVIAHDLRLDLYRIDLSAIVSKYIGETEANLRNVFDAAEDGAAVLFFDECDALFGKRTEVRESHDRFANIQINYLLQRLEAYRGLAILATNMKSALDAAFIRRLRFIVNFPYPESEQRESIWRKAFPAAVPRDRLDYVRLGRINLAGGSIHAAALHAAFLAAQERSRVGMGHVLSAVRAEFMKLGRPVNEAEFRWEGRRGVAA